MPPKAKAAPAGKSAAKSSWENELVQESYQEPGFSSEVHLILGEDQETSLQVQERLKETITNRQRFSMVTAEQANELVLDKKNRGQGMYSEILEQCKGVDGADITDVSQLQPGVLAKLVKTLLLRDKEADMVRRNLRPGTADEGSKGGKRKGSAKKGSARKKSAKSPKRTPSAKKKAGKGKGAETPEVEEKKKWSNLKKRGEVEEEEIVVPKYIDDEPENGPDHYVLLIGFEDPCLPALLAEAGIELTSIIQVRSEKGASKPHLFWDDLTTIFRRAEEKGKLLDCTRWQLTLYDADVEAINLYDEIASLAYDLKEKYAAYAAFNEKLEVVEIPTASGDEQNRLMGRYMSKTKDVPFLGQSINVLVHAMRESVCNSVESIEAVPTKVGNTALTNAINSALACFDLNEAELDELKDVYTPAKPEKKPAAPIMNQSDEIGMRLATLETPKRLAQIEKEMLLLYPLNLVYGLDNTKERDEAQGFLTDIDHHLWSAGKYSDSQIRQILLHMSAKQVHRVTADATGELSAPASGSIIPWDKRDHMERLKETTIKTETDDSTCYERFERYVATQRLLEAQEDATACRVHHLNRDDGRMIVFHNPVGQGANKNQNFESWCEKVVSKCRFRHWIEHIEPEVDEWLAEWESQKIKAKQEQERLIQAQLEAERVLSASALQESEMNTLAAYVIPGSLKAQARDKALEASAPALEKKKSSRKSLKKDSRPESKKKSSRSSSKASVGRNTPKPEIKKDDDPFPQYKSYNLKERIFAANGQQRRIFTSDGGYVSIKQSGFSDVANDLMIKIRQKRNTVTYYQQRPRDIRNWNPEEQKRPSSASSNSTQISSTSSSLAELIPPATFSSISAVLNDGISLAYSVCGDGGRPKHIDVEDKIEDRRFRYKLIDEEAAAREASKSPKGKKASAKPKNEKSEDIIDATPEPVAEPEKEEKLQQLYMSTPDGTHLRFGIHDGKIFVRLLRDHDKEFERLVMFEGIHRKLKSGEQEHLHKDGSVTYFDEKSKEKFIKRDGTSEGCKKILAYTSSDPTTNDRMFVRSDGLTIVKRQFDEIIQYPDGTRVTKTDSDVQVEKPGWPCILFEENAEKCMIVMANGTYVQITAAGRYQMSHSSGAYFTLEEDGTFVFSAEQSGYATHIIRQMDPTALEIIEPDGLKTIQVSNIGKTAIIHNEDNEESEERQITEDNYSPRDRIFYVRSKDQVYEFLDHDCAKHDIESIQEDPMSAALHQQVPEAPNEKAVTLLTPQMRAPSWSIHSYQEETLVPPYLRQHNLRKCGSGDTRNGHLTADDDQNAPQPPMLKIRSIVVNETVTAEMKKFVAEKMDQVYDEIQARKLEELPKVASDIAIVIERERSDLLERFLKLSCETDTATLRAHWIAQTRTPSPQPQAPLLKKMTDEDWKRVQDEREEYRRNLKALKEKRIPNYWESEDGKRFLEVLSKTGGCAKAAAKLPPPEKQAKPSDTPPATPAESNRAKSRPASARSVSTPLPPLEKRKPPIILPRSMGREELIQQQVEMEKIVGYKHPFGMWGYRCDFNPGSLDLGDLIEGKTYRRVVQLQNSGFSKLSFKILSPSLTGLTAKYKIGPLAPGLSAKIEVIFKASGEKATLREDGVYDFVNHLTLEKPIGEKDGIPQIEDYIKLQVAARIIPLSEVERRNKLGLETEKLARNVTVVPEPKKFDYRNYQ